MSIEAITRPALVGIPKAPAPAAQEPEEPRHTPEQIQAAIKVHRFQVLLRHHLLRKTSANGLIILTDQTIADQHWTHGMAEVVAVGPSVYRGKKFEDMGLTPEDGPKVGDIVFFESRAPRRFKFNGELLLMVPDDAIGFSVDPDHADKISFTIA
jgi:co-chaperonin GroES (HSP10)